MRQFSTVDGVQRSSLKGPINFKRELSLISETVSSSEVSKLGFSDVVA